MDAETLQMLQTIIPAVISAIVALIVAGKQNKTTVAELNQKHDEQLALILYRIEQLEKSVAKHNNLVERLGVVETKVEILNGKKNGQ